MKKITVKLTYDQVCGLDRWMDDCLGCLTYGNAQKAVGAMLAMWQLTKLKPKTYIRQYTPIKFKIDAPLAYAFAFFIETCTPNMDDLGNQLIKIYGEIDRVFNT